MNPRNLLIATLLYTSAVATAQQSGLTYERWDNISGTSVEILRQHGINARVPDHVGSISLAQTPVNIADHFGARLRGQLIAPATGDYTFFISGDDNVELWLSQCPENSPTFDTTAPWNRRLIAWHRHASPFNNWTRFPTQRSQAIRLEAGQAYYIEALQNENTGGDHLSLGWHRVEAGRLATTTWSPLSVSFTTQPNSNTNFSIASGQIAETKDKGAFHHRPWTGDGTFTLEIGNLNNPDPSAMAGLMLREALDENARHAFLARRPGGNDVALVERLTTDEASTEVVNSSENPSHLRLTRTGDTITAFISSDGVTWSPLGSTIIEDLLPTVHIGFAAASNSPANNPLTGWHGPLDSRENPADAPIIAPAANFGTHHWQPESATWTPQPNGTIEFDVTSGQIWGTMDLGSFHARTWTGDGEFTTWIGDFETDQASAKLGIMLRAHAGANAQHVSLFRSTGNLAFQRRTAQGGTTATSNNTGSASHHKWLRIIRAGNAISTFSSLDGRVWDARGSVTISGLPATILIGQAVSSMSDTKSIFGTFGTLTALHRTASEVIPGTHLVQHTPHPEDLLDVGLPESWMLANNLDPQNPFGPNGPHGDPDNDGIDNLAEFQNGTDPHSPDVISGALTRELWTGINGRTIPSLVTHSRFYDLPNEITFVSGIDFDTSTMGVQFGMRYRGTITPPVTGNYRFWIAGDDNAELWIADGTITPHGEASPRTDAFGKRQIAWVEDTRTNKDHTDFAAFETHPSQRSGNIFLQAGQSYYIEAIHKGGGGREHVAVAWQPPGQKREIIPGHYFQAHSPTFEDADDDGLPDPWQIANGLDDPALTPLQRGQYGDPDGDGLTNLLEYQHGTNPLHQDTDGDNLTDFDEIFRYGTNPLVPNILAATPIPQPIVTQQYSAYTGGWTHNSDGTLSAWDRRGEISYTFEITQPGIHEISVTGSAIGDIRTIERLPIVLSLNGIPIANRHLVSQNGAPDTIHATTPLLAPGIHTLTILHDNYLAARRLKIHSIEVIRLGGEDLNENGIPDWAEHNALAANALTRVPTQSRTSPVSIEGITQDLSRTLVEGASGSFPLTASINNTFFTDVPLAEDTPTTLTASFLQGTIPPQSHSIEWIPTNLLDFDQGELHIRHNDALRLHAHVEGASGSFTLQGSTGVPPAPSEPQPSHQPITLTFTTPGTHTLTVNYFPLPMGEGQGEGAQHTSTVTIHVHTADFGPYHSVRAYSPRDWTPNLLGPSHLIETDDRITLAETTPFPLPLGEGQGEGAQHVPRTFRAAVHHAGTRHTLARLPHDVDGAPSAILARGTIHGFYLAYLDETNDAKIITKYPDGTWLMAGTMVAVNLPPDIIIKISMIIQGGTINNGNQFILLNSSKFNANGIVNIFYERKGHDDPRLCNKLELFTQPQ